MLRIMCLTQITWKAVDQAKCWHGVQSQNSTPWSWVLHLGPPLTLFDLGTVTAAVGNAHKHLVIIMYMLEWWQHFHVFFCYQLEYQWMKGTVMSQCSRHLYCYCVMQSLVHYIVHSTLIGLDLVNKLHCRCHMWHSSVCWNSTITTLWFLELSLYVWPCVYSGMPSWAQGDVTTNFCTSAASTLVKPQPSVFSWLHDSEAVFYMVTCGWVELCSEGAEICCSL